jgi:hypothetical protein
MNYNTDLVIKYRVFLNNSYTTENDINNVCISEIVYQENFLEAFYLTEYNDKIVGEQQTLLYELLIQDERIQLVLEKLSKKTNFDDKYIVFFYLFSYPLFHITHELITNYLLNNEIPNELFETMNEEIEKM